MSTALTTIKRFIEHAAAEQAVAEHAPTDMKVADSYDALIAYNRRLFFVCPIVAIESPQPFFYKSVEEMFAAIEADDYRVWNGDSFPPGHPYAAFDGTINRNTGNQKAFLTSRIVHDYFDHYQKQIGFGTFNELRLAALRFTELPDTARMAHVCEFVTQICYYEIEGEYPQQKAFRVSNALMTEWESLVRSRIFTPDAYLCLRDGCTALTEASYQFCEPHKYFPELKKGVA